MEYNIYIFTRLYFKEYRRLINDILKSLLDKLGYI